MFLIHAMSYLFLLGELYNVYSISAVIVLFISIIIE